MLSIRFVPCAAVALVLAAESASASPTFTAIPLAFNATSSQGIAISADGTTVAGMMFYGPSAMRAYRWTAATGTQDLGPAPEGGTTTVAGISSDGTVIVGTNAYEGPNRTRAYRWVAGQGFTDLPLGAGASNSQAMGVSGDGTTVAANLFFPGPVIHAAVWTPSNGYQDLTTLPQSGVFTATAISRDASTVLGGDPTGPLRWTAAGGIQRLQSIPGEITPSANALNADGTIAAGSSRLFGGGGQHAVLWDAAGVPHDLGILAGASTSNLLTLNDAGNAGGGIAMVGGVNHALYWSSFAGMLDLNAWLPAQGIDLTGWVLIGVTSISADGSTVAGTGTFNGVQRAWTASNVPAPSAAGLLGLTGIAAFRRRR